MASCEFAGGIKNVRGTITKHVYYVDGVKHTKSVIAKVTKSGKQKVYIRETTCRKKSLSDGEIKARNLFHEVMITAKYMSEEEKARYAEEWKKNKYKFNGKKYGTLRGYIIARLYQRYKDARSVEKPR